MEKTAWYYEAVNFVQSQSLMGGVGDGAFNPNGTTSRAMIATILWRLADQPAPSGGASFSDVADGLWYTEAVKWAQENGIVTGYDGKFAPDAPITREQLAAMLYRYAQAQGKGYTGAWTFLLDFPDASGVSEYADEAMHWMVMTGVINGKDGVLAPQASASRAEAAQMLMGFCDALR